MKARYKEFIANTKRLFQKKKFPEWKSELEYPLIEKKLKNGIRVDMDFDTEPSSDFNLIIDYPVGFIVEPASHLLEHFIGHPKGFDLDNLLPTTGISYEGSTNANYTTFKVYINRLSLIHSTKRNAFVLEDLISLLYGMTMLPDINKYTLEAEKERVRNEELDREDNVDTRMYDYILPQILFGVGLCYPPLSKELDYTVAQLQNVHKRRPHDKIAVTLWGNPQCPGAVDRCMEIFGYYFGELEKSTIKRKRYKKLNDFFPYGKNIQTIAKDPLEMPLSGIMLKIEEDKDPWRNVLTQASLSLLGGIITEETYYARVGYRIFDYRRSYDNIKQSFWYKGVSTEDPIKYLSFLNDLLKRFLENDKNLHLKNRFAYDKSSAIYDLFAYPTTRRFDFARYLHVSTKNNAEQLYVYLQKVTLADVLEQANRIFIPENTGRFIYCGKEISSLKEFSLIQEEDLIANWKNTWTGI